MRGIATIDRQPDAAQIAVWVTSISPPIGADHGNAVVMDADDPGLQEAVRSLTRCCAVLLTDDSTLDGLPVEGRALTVQDLDDLLAETEKQQQRILDAIGDYKRRTRSRTLAEPTFPRRPERGDFIGQEDDATQRALSTANYLRAVWSNWLRTDAERRNRTVQPRTGATPWIMPEDMNGATVPDFPEAFADRLHEQPLV